jgi:hypothetical protein
MATIDPTTNRDLRVCPDCGYAASAAAFCEQCGMNLTKVKTPIDDDRKPQSAGANAPAQATDSPGAEQVQTPAPEPGDGQRVPARAPYNILGIRSVSDPYDPLYPRLSKDAKGIHTCGSDGKNVEKHSLSIVSAYTQEEDGKPKRLGSFTDGVATLFVTDSRVVVVNHDFKTADTSDLLWGFDAEYLASALLAKVRTHNRALVGHVPLICVERIAQYTPKGRLDAPPRVRLWVHERTGDTRRLVGLDCQLTGGQKQDHATRLVASILRRSCDYWLANYERLGVKIPIQYAMGLKSISTGRYKSPELIPGKWAQHHVPLAVDLREQTPKQIGITAPSS